MSARTDTETRDASGPRIAPVILAAGTVIAFCYWAETVVLTLVLSILMTYLLDPVCSRFERARLPRWIASLLAVFGVVALVSGGLFLLGGRIQGLGEDWSGFSQVVGRAVSVIDTDVDDFLHRVVHLEPGPRSTGIELLLGDSTSLRSFFFRQLDSLYSALEMAAFVPFLVFFMLSEKNELWRSSLGLFSRARRAEARRALEELSRVLRGYVVGNLIIAGVLVGASWVFFLILGLDYPFLTALL
jgi:predicted PurR-regulated permease PerM